MLDQMFSQVGGDSLTIEKLSDGSTAIVDNRVKSVHSLNQSATAVWEACANGATEAQIRKTIEAQSGFPVDSEAIRQALAQLQRANLVESGSVLPLENIDLGRRSMLKRVGVAGAFAIPVVLTLTASEQKAYAAIAISGTTPAPTTTRQLT